MRVYFSGIGGVAIGPLAEIACDAGYEVLGSDLEESLMTTLLKQRGITMQIGPQSGELLRREHEATPIDWFVYTAALPHDHPELVAASELGIRAVKRDGFLAEFLHEKNLQLIAISGTHGKTTTTGMMVWAMQQLGVPVSYSLGTTISFGPSGAYDPSSNYFIYECDEFDRNMLKFHPYLSLLTSLDYDHPDTYPTEKDYTAAFSQFLQQSKHTIGWEHDLEKLADAPSWRLRSNEAMDIPLPGAHSRRNATLVAKAIEYLADDSSALLTTTNLDTILSNFPGTNRRFEKLGEHLYSDYGHHPVEIAATLQLASELSDHVVLVYQPHQNVRQHEVREQYTNCASVAEEVYWLPTYQSREDPSREILSPAQLTNKLVTKNTVHISELNTELWSEIQRHRDAGHLVLCMGAGSIDGWLRTNVAVAQVADVLVRNKQGCFVLQQRDHTPGINNPGMITAFGGAVEGNETPRQGAARELQEETNIRFSTDELRYICAVYQERVNDGKPRWVSFYLLENADTANLEVYEGEGAVIIPPDADFDTYPALSTTVRTILTQLPSTMR